LYSTNSPLEFKTVSRDRLYFDQYQYCMRVNLVEAGCLRKLGHEFIDQAIARRRAWLIPRTGLNGMAPRNISEETSKNLHAVCDVLLSTKHKYKLQVHYWGMYMYTNDCALLIDILAVPQPPADSLKLTQAVVNRPRNTIALKNPQHKYRSYFISRSLSDNQKKSIGNFLTVNQDIIRASPGVIKWLAGNWSWTMPNYFIDHNDQSCLIMLSLIYPGLIKNTFDIIKS